MTELHQQNVQETARRMGPPRHRRNSINCEAIQKDPDGGLICTARGLALGSPHLWYGDQSSEQVLTSNLATLTVDTENLNTSTDYFTFASNELTVLQTGMLKLEAKVVVETEDAGRFGFEIIIDEDEGSGYSQLADTLAANGRGNL